MKKFLLALTTCLSSICYAQSEASDQKWRLITSTDTHKWYGKNESGDYFNVDGKKKNAYGYILQKENIKSKTFQYIRIFVMLDTCRRGYGYLVSNDMEGAFTGRENFARFGKTISDALGEMACKSWEADTGKAAHANGQSPWEVVAKAKDSGDMFMINTATLKNRSFNNKPSRSGLFGYDKIKEHRVGYSVYLVQYSDCKAGHGKIYEFDFDEKLISKSDYVLDGNSMITAVAQQLCDGF